MLARAAFTLITLFWLTMNVLLWRAEFGARPGAGDSVPVRLVWQKILTAPDSSSLVIMQNGRRTGVCHWFSGVGEQWSEIGDENVPSGLPAPVGYRLRWEGSVILANLTNQVRFAGSLTLGPDREWKELHARLSLHPATCEIQSVAAERTVRLAAEVDGVPFSRVIRFSELQNPSALLHELAGPLAGAWLYGIDLPALPAGSPQPGLRWEASEDELPVGRTRLKVYRLQTQWLDRDRVTVWASRVGEILRVELPQNVVLVNDQLTSR